MSVSRGEVSFDRRDVRNGVLAADRPKSSEGSKPSVGLSGVTIIALLSTTGFRPTNPAHYPIDDVVASIEQ